MTGERDEVGAPRLHVGDVVRHVLAGVDHGKRSGVVSGGAQRTDGRDRAEHVAHGGERKDLGAVEELVEVGQIELAVGGEGHPAKLDATLVAAASATARCWHGVPCA